MRFLAVIDAGNYLVENYDPLGLMYLLSAVRDAGHDVKVVTDDLDNAKQVIAEWDPELIGYSVFTGNQMHLIHFNQQLKEHHDFISIFGGPHPTFFPEMIEHTGVDITCQGEAEIAIVELLAKIENGEDYTSVKNFWIKKNGEIFHNPVRPLETDIDKIAFPAREYYYSFPVAAKNKYRNFITARGCPYSCTYCYVPKIRELYRECGSTYFRQRSVENVIEEIADVVSNYPVEYVHFSTDNFTADKKWVLEFAQQYRSEINLPFTCLTHPVSTTPELCRALKDANCKAMYLGLESGNEQIRRQLLNRRMTNQQIIKAAEAIRGAGIRIKTFNIVGYPGETVEQAFETIQLNQQCHADLASCTLLIPYPRTKLCDYAIENGYFDGDYDMMPGKWSHKSPLKNPQKTQIERLQKLFGVAVNWSWLTPLVRIAIHLPLKGFYALISHFHWQYRYYFYIWGNKITPRVLFEFLNQQLFSRILRKVKRLTNRERVKRSSPQPV